MAFICKPNNRTLREALDAPDGFPVSKHRERTEAMRAVYSHSSRSKSSSMKARVCCTRLDSSVIAAIEQLL
jgi:hypothetical protein